MRATISMIALLTLAALTTFASDPAPSTEIEGKALDDRFRQTVAPFIRTYCVDCHGGGKGKPKGDLNLARYTSLDAIARDLGRWEGVMEELEAEAMPPAEAKRQPEDAQRDEVIAWIRALREREAR